MVGQTSVALSFKGRVRPGLSMLTSERTRARTTLPGRADKVPLDGLSWALLRQVADKPGSRLLAIIQERERVAAPIAPR